MCLCAVNLCVCAESCVRSLEGTLVASAREWDFTAQMVCWYCVFARLSGNIVAVARCVTRGKGFNTAYWLPRKLSFEHRGAKLASCPGRHLASLRPWLLHVSTFKQQVTTKRATQSKQFVKWFTGKSISRNLRIFSRKLKASRWNGEKVKQDLEKARELRFQIQVACDHNGSFYVTTMLLSPQPTTGTDVHYGEAKHAKFEGLRMLSYAGQWHEQHGVTSNLLRYVTAANNNRRR